MHFRLHIRYQYTERMYPARIVPSGTFSRPQCARTIPSWTAQKTGKRFHDGVQQFLSVASDEPFLPPAEVAFPPHGRLVILGRLRLLEVDGEG